MTASLLASDPRALQLKNSSLYQPIDSQMQQSKASSSLHYISHLSSNLASQAKENLNQNATAFNNDLYKQQLREIT